MPLSVLSYQILSCTEYCATVEEAAIADLQAAQRNADDLEGFGLRPNLTLEEEWELLQQAGIMSLWLAFKHIIDDAHDAISIPGQYEPMKYKIQ